MEQINSIQWALIGLYGFAMFAVGYWAGYKDKEL